MTTRILTGTYTAGYTMLVWDSALTIAQTGIVDGLRGRDATLTAPSTAGGLGFETSYRSIMTNRGTVAGGRGGAGYYKGAYAQFTASQGGVGAYGVERSRIVNYGLIEGGAAIDLAMGGVGVTLGRYAGLSNEGTVAGGASSRARGAFGAPAVVEESGARVVNNGLIVGGFGDTGGVGVYGGWPATVTNNGSIEGGSGATIGVAIQLDAGGAIINGAAGNHAATITGKIGVESHSRAATTITNFGTIDGVGGVSVDFRYGYNSWLYFDRLIAEPGSSLIGVAHGGYAVLEIGDASGTISGLGAGTQSAADGQISGGLSMSFNDFGSYIIDPGGAWTLAGQNVLYNNQALTNFGSLYLQSAPLLAYRSINNQGFIGAAGSGYAIDLKSRGVLVNGGTANATALISGGVACGPGSYVTVANFGTIRGGAVGVELATDNVLRNGASGAAAAAIFAPSGDGVLITGVGVTLINHGAIHGAGGTLHPAYCGLRDQGGGVIYNGDSSSNTALITGVTGVYADGRAAMTLMNYGTIWGNGGVAVQLSSRLDHLVDESGSRLVGSVAGGGGMLELAGANGTISGLGAPAAFSGFGSYRVDVYASWSMTGTDSLGAGITLTNGGSLTVRGALTNNGVVEGYAGRRYGAPGYLGLALSGAGRVTNHGLIAGGAGVDASLTHLLNGVAYPGGAGGVGLSVAAVVAGYAIANDGRIAGGAGGTGGYTPWEPGYTGGVGGAGGAGVSLAGGGFSNSGIIAGGAAGKGGYGSLNGGAGGVGGAGVTIGSQGTVINTGSILGGAGGLGGHGTQGVNGVVGLGGDGVAIAGGGVVINGGTTAQARRALISGEVGVYAGQTGAATVTNFGTIKGAAGGAAIRFEATADRLIEEAGGVFAGAVEGGGGTLELGSLGGSGTLTGLGAAFSGFATYAVDKGATWTLAGPTITIANDQSLVDTGRLTIAGSLINAGVVEAAGGGVITLSGSAVSGAGELFAATASTVLVKAADIQGGVLIGAGTGKIEFSGVGALNGAAAAVTIKGQSFITNGSTLTVSGSIAGNGRISIDGTTLATEMVIRQSLVLSGGGSIYLENNIEDAIVGEGGSLVNVSDRLFGGGAVSGAISLDNQSHGQIFANGSVALTIDVGAGLLSNEGLIEADGDSLIIDSALANAGRVYALNATLTLAGPVSGTGSGFIKAGTLIAAGAFDEHVVFLGATGMLELAQSQTYSGRINGFSTLGGTSLDLRDITFKSAGEAAFSGTRSGGILTVADGSHTARITLLGDYTSTAFVASSDGEGGTVVMAKQANSPGAFAMAMAGLGSTGPPALAAPQSVGALTATTLVVQGSVVRSTPGLT